MTRSIHEELESVPPALMHKPEWIVAAHKRHRRTQTRRLWAAGGFATAVAAALLVWSVMGQRASERPVAAMDMRAPSVVMEPSVAEESSVAEEPSMRGMPASSNQSTCAAERTSAERSRCYVRARGSDLIRCMVDHAGDAPDLEFLSISFDIDKGGKTTQVDLAPASVKETGLGACVMEVAAGIRFGPQDEHTRFSIPLRISRD